MMYEVTQHISFCYGHRLLEYPGKCAHLHGHNATAELTFSSEKLNALGMVIDFTEIKNKVKKWIDTEIDHRMLLKKGDPLVDLLRKQGEPIVETSENPTAEHLARMLYDEAKRQGLPVTMVRVFETPTQVAAYREETRG